MKMFRVATFNVENLLAPGVRVAGRKDPPYSLEEFNDKISWISNILDAGQPSLIGFQELFSLTALQAIVERTRHLNAAGAAGPGVTIYAPDLEEQQNYTAAGEARGPFCGLVTTFPVLSSQHVTDFPEEVVRKLHVQSSDDPASPIVELPVRRFQRPVLQAEVLLPHPKGKEVKATVFVAHLKSKRPQFLPDEDAAAQKDPLVQAVGLTRSLILRAAESVALRALVVKAAAGNQNPIFLLGDLNDDLPAVTTQIIAGEEPWRFKSRDEKRVDWDRLLYSAHDLQEERSFRDVNYTHIYNGRYEVLDHVFVSEEFYPGNPRALGDVRITRIFNDHLMDERLVTSIDNRTNRVRSDHGVPITEISWRDD
jgi:predicted extracellular nuclease